MSKLLLVSVCLLLPTLIFSQATPKPSAKKKEREIIKVDEEVKVFQKVEIESDPSDLKAWNKHIGAGLVLPTSITDVTPPGIYKVEVQFVVDVHGYIGEVKAISNPGYGLAEHSVKIISSYKGDWRPANQCGRSVKSYKKHFFTYTIGNQ